MLLPSLTRFPVHSGPRPSASTAPAVPGSASPAGTWGTSLSSADPPVSVAGVFLVLFSMPSSPRLSLGSATLTCFLSLTLRTTRPAGESSHSVNQGTRAGVSCRVSSGVPSQKKENKTRTAEVREALGSLSPGSTFRRLCELPGGRCWPATRWAVPRRQNAFGRWMREAECVRRRNRRFLVSLCSFPKLSARLRFHSRRLRALRQSVLVPASWRLGHAVLCIWGEP